MTWFPLLYFSLDVAVFDGDIEQIAAFDVRNGADIVFIMCDIGKASIQNRHGIERFYLCEQLICLSGGGVQRMTCRVSGANRE